MPRPFSSRPFSADASELQKGQLLPFISTVAYMHVQGLCRDFKGVYWDYVGLREQSGKCKQGLDDYVRMYICAKNIPIACSK